MSAGEARRAAASCTIRRGIPGDAAMLAALGRKTFLDAFAADNTPDNTAAYVAHHEGIDARWHVVWKVHDRD